MIRNILCATSAIGMILATQTAHAQTAPVGQDQASDTDIIVTAQKREERLIDVPQSVSVVAGEDLERAGATQFRDFANTVPGLAFTTVGAGQTQVSLRGVTAGVDISPTVGIYVDDVPYGASTSFAGGATLALDVGLFDLDRVEVLRGPQGTLYGASSMGGLLKYVTPEPNSNATSVNLRAGLSATEHGGINGFGAAAVNIPLSPDRAGLRLSGFYSRDGGYIDDVARGVKDVNSSDVYGGRADLLLTPAEGLRIRLSGFVQNIDRDGQGVADYSFAGTPADGSLDQRRLLGEPFEQRFRLVSGTVSYDFGPVELTSISAYQTARTSQIQDLSVAYVPRVEFYFPDRDYSAVGYRVGTTTKKFTQEVRLASAPSDSFEWLIGGYYAHEKSNVPAEFLPIDAAGNPATNDLFTYEAPSKFEEIAAFANATLHITGKLDLIGGLRYAANDQRYAQGGGGFFGVVSPPTTSEGDVFTYLASLRYEVSDNATAYARFATGYRPGGPNFRTNDPATGLPVGPAAFESDSLESYEIGFKGQTADRRFGLDVSAYRIDWDNIQLSVVRNLFAGIANADGGARVYGFELAATAKPVPAFTLAGTLAYQHAELRAAQPDIGAVAGERLPNVPRLMATLNADYRFGDSAGAPTLGATLRHVGSREASFDASVSRPQYHLPAYTTVDLRLGASFGAVDAQLFVHNLFDERGQLSAATLLGVPQVAMIQPRTFGIALSSRF